MNSANSSLKVSGFQTLQTEGKTLSEDLKPHYHVYVDCMEFTESATAALLQCEKLSGLNCVHHHILTDRFFSLLHSLVTVHLWMQDCVQSKKAICACYNYLYSTENLMVEPHFQRLSAYFAHYEKPLSTIQDTFAGMGIFITTLLQSLSVEFTRYGFMSVEQLRKEGGLLIGNNVKTAAVDDSKFRLMPFFNSYSTYVVISFLCCPQELLKQQMCADILKTVLSQGLGVSHIRSEVLNVVAEFDFVIKSNPKLSKVKNIISESFGTQLARAIQVHHDRREYLRYVLRQLVCLCDDRPFVLGFKFPVIECALSLAREELMWYFNHHDRTVATKFPKSVSKSAMQPIEPSVTEIMALILQLQDVVIKHHAVVEEFYANLFASHYGPLMENIVIEIMRTNAPSDAVTQVLLDILESVKTATKNSSFDVTRYLEFPTDSI